MTGPRRIVGISGNITRPSRTRTLVETVLAGAAGAGLGAVEVHDVVEAVPALGAATRRDGAPPDLDRIWSAIESCDALVVGSPVFKGSYGGLFKHLFDLIDKDALRGRPVVLCATGRLPAYGSVIDEHLRPLFAFFAARIVGPGIYASDADCAGPALAAPRVADAIAAAVAALGQAMAARPSAGGDPA